LKASKNGTWATHWPSPRGRIRTHLPQRLSPCSRAHVFAADRGSHRGQKRSNNDFRQTASVRVKQTGDIALYVLTLSEYTRAGFQTNPLKCGGTTRFGLRVLPLRPTFSKRPCFVYAFIQPPPPPTTPSPFIRALIFPILSEPAGGRG
jgi:hypothetical protein